MDETKKKKGRDDHGGDESELELPVGPTITTTATLQSMVLEEVEG
jgi:hypothetical protein